MIVVEVRLTSVESWLECGHYLSCPFISDPTANVALCNHSPERYYWFVCLFFFYFVIYLLFFIFTFLMTLLPALKTSHFTLRCYIFGFVLHRLYKMAFPCSLRWFFSSIFFHSNFISYFLAISPARFPAQPCLLPGLTVLLFRLGLYPVLASSFLGHFLWPSFSPPVGLVVGSCLHLSQHLVLV